MRSAARTRIFILITLRPRRIIRVAFLAIVIMFGQSGTVGNVSHIIRRHKHTAVPQWLMLCCIIIIAVFLSSPSFPPSSQNNNGGMPGRESACTSRNKYVRIPCVGQPSPTSMIRGPPSPPWTLGTGKRVTDLKLKARYSNRHEQRQMGQDNKLF